MKIVFFILIPFWLFASQILNYNVYDRTDRVDLMLTFDTPFEGTITQKRKAETVLIKLSNVTIESPKVKTLNSKFLNKLTITPINSQVEIIARIPKYVTMKASKTADAYGLRLRFIQMPTTEKNHSKDDAKNLSNLPTKQSSELEENYILVIVILTLGIIILFWLKRSMANSATNSSQPSVFKSKKEISHPTEASIRFQKPLDQHNSVMMLDYADESYLVVIGNNNIVLDKFHDSKPATQSEFESILDTKEQELESYLQLDKIDTVEANEVLENYKEKASL
ncbi:MAG: hypothetical protein U9R50_07870 [Campylobacterota bacterium]|nr:hypothetical protein [Campylobacterota bacterium]